MPTKKKTPLLDAGCEFLGIVSQVQEEKGKKLKDFEAALPGNKDIEAPAASW